MADFFQDMWGKTKKFANNAVDETKDAAQKAKLNNKISNEMQMIDRNMVEIGRYFYEQYKDTPPQELAQAFNNVRVLQDSIAVSQNEIRDIEASMAQRKQASQTAQTGGYAGYQSQGYQAPPNMGAGNQGYQAPPNMVMANQSYQAPPNMDTGNDGQQ